MHIAILGGGFAGLSAAYYLQKKNHDVTLFERDAHLGGLAGGFKKEGWDWYLEKTYHHWFSNDYDILNFAKEVGFTDILFDEPLTSSFYSVQNKASFIPLDTPFDLLRFPLLSLPVKIRVGLVLAFLKVSPFFTAYERQTAEEILEKSMGKRAWDVLWSQLFRKKFGKYAGNILMSFFWSRIKKRTKRLGYPRGGYQTFLNHIESVLSKNKVEVKTSTPVESVEQSGKRFKLNITNSKAQIFDIVVSTLPTPILIKVAGQVFSQKYMTRLSSLKYLHAINVIFRTTEPVLKNIYWLNIIEKTNPIMVAVQHTNFINSSHYHNEHILYVGNYLEGSHELFKMREDEIGDHYKKNLHAINPSFDFSRSQFSVGRGAFAQPIFDKEFVKNKPDFETPVKNFYIANLDMTYPHDRGTNYAVALGRKVSGFF